MKIGLLAYHSAYNFGANLQILSTIYYLNQHGHIPVVINWVPYDLEEQYKKITPNCQQNMHQLLFHKYYPLTRLCRTSKEIALIIEELNIEAVVIGSDAVAQHHPFMSRIIFPSKRIISMSKCTSDRMFPNPFWGEFLDYLPYALPVALLSVSSQNSAFQQIHFDVRYKMLNAIRRYSYISVRDSWTAKMFYYLSGKKIYPQIAPDPVFGFNRNFSDIPSRDEISKKFNLPDKYFLLSFRNSYAVSEKWIEEFSRYSLAAGIHCYALPFPDGVLFRSSLDNLSLPISPIDWYALIKYSQGYIGHNMHPIVVALHNAVPFYSFDNYGIVKFLSFFKKDTSKIYDILARADMLDYWIPSHRFTLKKISAKLVFSKLLNFDRNKALSFSNYYYQEYEMNMINIINSLKK